MRKLILLFLFFIPAWLFAQRTILHCGRLIDVTRGAVITEQSIIIEGNKISDIQKGYIDAAGTDQVIDLKRSTVMPGLIDCHVAYGT